MSDFLLALGQFEFLRHALVGALLASIGCGVIGSFVVVKRIGYLAGGISHSVLGGMGLALFLGASPISGALAAALLASLLIGWIRLNWRQQEDTLIGAVWAIGMAIGILFIARTPGYNVDLLSYLFGNVLMVAPSALWQMAILDLVILLLVLAFYRQFLAVSFDEEFARLRGIPVGFFYQLLLAMVALAVVLLIQVVGLILVIALLTLPAASAAIFVRSLGRMMWLASLLGALYSLAGLVLAYRWDLPTGATIILVAGCGYLLASLLGQAWRQRRRRLLLQAGRGS